MAITSVSQNTSGAAWGLIEKPKIKQASLQGNGIPEYGKVSSGYQKGSAYSPKTPSASEIYKEYSPEAMAKEYAKLGIEPGGSVFAPKAVQAAGAVGKSGIALPANNGTGELQHTAKSMVPGYDTGLDNYFDKLYA
ncbi:hypothetical protein IJ843_05420 [bacterium]|nr:hypothetical protein [bacterium]